MQVFDAYLGQIENPQHRMRVEQVLCWVAENYPVLQPRIAWNQPMFTDHNTFIIAFSVAKRHLAVAPEKAAIYHFSDEIIQAGYSHSSQLLRMEWDKMVDYALLEKIINYNIKEKAGCVSFWRK